MGFTDRELRALKPGDRTYERSDGKGLRIRVTPNGVRSLVWYVRERSTGQRTTITIGRVGEITLAAARDEVASLRKLNRAGKLAEHLKATRGPTEEEWTAAAAGTVAAAAPNFLAYLRDERERKAPEQAEAMFQRDILPVLGSKAIADVGVADVNAICQRIYARNRQGGRRGKSAAQHTVALVRQFFKWTIATGRREVNHGNPASFVEVKPDDPDQRVLSPDELAPMWGALDRLSPLMRDAARLLMLVPLRTGELRLATWDRVDFERATLTVPPEHLKTRGKQAKRPWLVPLSPGALAILRGLRARSDAIGSRYVLASDRVGPKPEGEDRTRHQRGDPVSRTNLVAKVGALFDGDGALALPGGPATPHAFRRTCRTGLARLQIPAHVAKRCLDHATAGEDVDERDYVHHDYLDERREALEAWDRYLSARVAGDDEATARAKARPDVFERVVSIRRGKGRVRAAPRVARAE